MEQLTGQVGVIGAGVMGKALIKGLLNKNVLKPEQLWAATKTDASAKRVQDELSITACTDYSKKLKDTDVLLLCVKPSGVKKVLDQLTQYGVSTNTLLISIVTGISLAEIESGLPGSIATIRAMPNTPAIVGHGMTVASPGTHTTAEHLQMARQIFEAVGEYSELEEEHLNAVTALSGCGPAYFYLIMEALADGGVRVGLPRDIALKLVIQTAQGAASMVQNTGLHPASLRDDVTTPAGCTIGALLTMEDGKIRSVLARAVEEATTIAEQLGTEKTNLSKP